MDRRNYSDSDSRSHVHAADDKNVNENSNTCKDMSKLLLPQDLMLHIFHLVPLYSLIHSARYVCKHWNSTIATFTQLYGGSVRSAPGILVENCRSKGNYHFLEFKDHANARFDTIYLSTPPNMGFLVATCHGIFMLVDTQGHIFLANPILKCWLRLPRFPTSDSYMHMVYRCAIACVPHTAKFKLFFQDVVMHSGALWYVFYVLRAGIDNSWKELATKQAPFGYHLSWKPLYNGGNHLYWITSEQIIVIDVDREVIVREYPLYLSPQARKESYLWIGNYLSCIVTKCSFKAHESQIHILDFDSGKWSLYHDMRFDYRAACGRKFTFPPDVEFRLCINDLIIFQVTLTNEGITYMHFAYNLKTKQFTKMEDIDMGYYQVWPYTNSLVSFSTTSP